MSNISYTINARTPHQAVEAIMKELGRRLDIARAYQIRATGIKQNARAAGEVAALEGIIHTLTNLRIDPHAENHDGAGRASTDDAVNLVRAGVSMVRPPPAWLQSVEQADGGINLLAEGRVFEVRVR